MPDSIIHTELYKKQFYGNHLQNTEEGRETLFQTPDYHVLFFKTSHLILFQYIGCVARTETHSLCACSA